MHINKEKYIALYIGNLTTLNGVKVSRDLMTRIYTQCVIQQLFVILEFSCEIWITDRDEYCKTFFFVRIKLAVEVSYCLLHGILFQLV